MSHQSATPTEDPAPPRPNDETLALLLTELREARAETRRQSARLRFMGLALGLLAILSGWAGSLALSRAEPPTPVGPPTADLSPDARAARREQLLANLPAETRDELRIFAREAEWLDQYLNTWEPDQAGALVSLMLFRMAKAMETMPAMERTMRTLSTQMGALPAIVVELNQINAKMGVITADMDSTMGRAGRMMPWMPFAP